jgi:hypothetical protein
MLCVELGSLRNAGCHALLLCLLGRRQFGRRLCPECVGLKCSADQEAG